MSVEAMLSRITPPPQYGSWEPTETMVGEVTRAFHEIYASGLSTFFESTWFYFVQDGKMTFPQQDLLVRQVYLFLQDQAARRDFDDRALMRISAAKETRLVWQLAQTAYQTPVSVPPATSKLPPWNDALEARHRVAVVEALITGSWLPSNPLTYPYEDPDGQRVRQFGFWYALGDMVRRRDESNVPMARGVRDGCLARMRMYTCGCENRDLIYSIAVARELSGRYGASDNPTNTERLDENVPQNRLVVARRHISAQSAPDGASTNVLRRVALLGMLAFVDPGFNVRQAGPAEGNTSK